MKRLPQWGAGALAGVVLAWAESRRRLRKRVDSREERFAENITTAIAAAIATVTIGAPEILKAKANGRLNFEFRISNEELRKLTPRDVADSSF
jgi:hypothetical protein